MSIIILSVQSVLLNNINILEINKSDTYLEKFLFVHMLIAINIKHFEGYVKSCMRL